MDPEATEERLTSPREDVESGPGTPPVQRSAPGQQDRAMRSRDAPKRAINTGVPKSAMPPSSGNNGIVHKHVSDGARAPISSVGAALPPQMDRPEAHSADKVLQAILAAHLHLCEADYGRLTLLDMESTTVPGKHCAKQEEAPTVRPNPGAQHATGRPEGGGANTVISFPVVTRSEELLGGLSIHLKHCRPPSAVELEAGELCALHLADHLNAAKCEANLHALNQELEALVGTREAQSRALVLELSKAEQRERNRMAQELHDNLQQVLVAVKMKGHIALSEAGGPKTIQKMLDLTEEALACCRAVVADLSPPVLHGADLPETLHWLARHMKRQHGLEVELRIDESPCTESTELRLLLMQIARELLFNCVKHAKTKKAVLRVYCANGHILLEVADTGIGCDPHTLQKAQSESFGLTSIRERVTALGGSMHAWAAPTLGCRVWARLPAVTGPTAAAQQ